MGACGCAGESLSVPPPACLIQKLFPTGFPVLTHQGLNAKRAISPELSVIFIRVNKDNGLRPNPLGKSGVVAGSLSEEPMTSTMKSGCLVEVTMHAGKVADLASKIS